MTAEPLPPYVVRVSDRARHVRLTVSARDGLVVVVPRRWRGDVGAIVRSKRAWAVRSLARVAEARAAHQAGPEGLVPNAVALRITGETLRVVKAGGAGAARASRSGGDLHLTGVSDAAESLATLSRWLDREARILLPPRVATLARVHGVSPARVRITRARTRWGSCSSRGTISLSRTLLFLPPELADALILHELAHLRVMNHSAAFWAELETMDARARQHQVELRDAMRFVPPWVEV